MKWIIIILILILIALQYRLWVGEGSIAQQVDLERKIQQFQAQNDALRERNRILAMEVEALKSGLDAIEERAREDMGMVKKGEVFYFLIDPEQESKTDTQ